MTRNAEKWILLLVLLAVAFSPEGLAHTGVGAFKGRMSVGIWMDIASIPRDRSGIRRIVDDLADAGIADVYAQVFNRGLTIYPSEVAATYGLRAQRDMFAGLDPLKDLIEYAHLRGLRVHAWLDVLYVGYKERGALLERYPSWEMVTRDGSRGHGSPGSQQHWLSPASPQARLFLADLVGELVSRYDVDGVHFDYIRYPDPMIGDCGYEPDCMHGFLERFGIDPLAINTRQAEQGDAKSLHELALWNAWRSAKVTELVSILALEIANKRPGVLVSAAVAPIGAPDGPFPGLLQDWPYWMRSGILDYVVPMTYTSRPEELRGLARWIAFLLGQAHPPICGVQIWKRESCRDVVRQLTILSEEGAAGAVLFAQSYLGDDVALAVKSFLAASEYADGRPAFTSEDSRILQALPPMTVIPFTGLPPCVDGDLSDDVWLDAAHLSLSFDVMKPGRTWPGENPQIKIVYDAQGLYMAFSMALTGPLHRQVTATRDSPVFYYDSFEVFFDPFSSGSLFYHFAFDLSGTQYDATRLSGSSWNHNWIVACQEENGIWQSEVFIPFEAFGQRPDDLEEWGFNVCMNMPDSNRFVSWAPLPGIYATPRYFGKIRFQAGMITAPGCPPEP